MDDPVSVKIRMEELKLRLIHEATHSDESVKKYKEELAILTEKLKNLKSDTG